MLPKEVFPKISEVIKNPKYWKSKTLTYRGQKRYFDEDIRKGECYFCHLYGRTQNYHRITQLHHLYYDDEDPLRWTLELCTGCHVKLDVKCRRHVARNYSKRYDRSYFRSIEDRRFVNAEFKRLGLRR